MTEQTPLDQPQTKNHLTIFHSARLKLTGFYLAVVLVMSLGLTSCVRYLAQREFNDSGVAQRGLVRTLLSDLYSVPPRPYRTFDNFQSSQEDRVRQRLDDDVIIINVLVLITGGILSYWYAGRTLKPIEEAHETQARFAADASHELRTPLANIKVENEVFLRQKSFTNEEARQLIDSNLEEVQRLENLASNLLSLTQYENTTLNLEAIEVDGLVKSALEFAHKEAKTKNINFEQNVPVARVLGQADSLKQLLGIVIDNAMKYGPTNSTIFIDGIKTKDQYHISIRDQGLGISDIDLPQIFERLYRGDKSRNSQSQGYGLGLALAKEIARANDAQITARNYPSGGAQFVITLAAAKTK